MARAETFSATLAKDARGRIVVRVPFDPNTSWGSRSVHRVTGTIDGRGVRGALEEMADGYGLVMGPSWPREWDPAPGTEVVVTLAPEGPQRTDLAPDLVAALDAEPAAGAFFDSLATFYRKGYLRWIDGTKRRPDLRAARIAELVDLLKAGEKERPRG